jgi:hypothetical protein
MNDLFFCSFSVYVTITDRFRKWFVFHQTSGSFLNIILKSKEKIHYFERELASHVHSSMSTMRG